MNLANAGVQAGQLYLDSLCSGNEMYNYFSFKGRAGRPVKKPAVRAEQEAIQQQVIPLSLADEVKAYSAKVKVAANRNFWVAKSSGKLRRLDLSNIWKVVEDALITALGLDDSLCTSLQLSKEIDSERSGVRIYYELELFEERNE